MAGLRDIIIHQYDRIDYRVPFQVVSDQLPSVIEQLTVILADLRREAGET